ncbi:hypothetical protein TURU_140682 [Turdus rufiventris]|nr:hypothetical protein TURU_140682 [Turdus rufiventris]
MNPHQSKLDAQRSILSLQGDATVEQAPDRSCGPMDSPMDQVFWQNSCDPMGAHAPEARHPVEEDVKDPLWRTP